MTTQQLKRLGIVLVVVMGLWGLAAIIGRGGDGIEEGHLIGDVTAPEVDVVEFASAEDTIRLRQMQPGVWTVNGFPADASSIGDLFTALADATTGELAAQNPSSHARMEVDESNGTRLTVSRGEETLVNVLIGRQGRAYRTVYVRADGADEVYLVESQVGALAGRAVNDWRDKQILAVDTASVARIEVERGRDRYALVRGDSAWSFADGVATDSAAVQRLLGEFSSLDAQGSGFPTSEQADSLDFGTPDRRVSLLDAQGATLAALVFDSTTGNFWARELEGETVYQLYQWKANNLTPADSTLRRRD